MNLAPSGAPTLRLYNTAARAVVPVEPDADREVRIYTCGPTVYRAVHLGNLRSYLLADCVRRLVLASGHRVRHVKNITDVGHMRQELLDRGEDKVVAEALRAGLTSLEIARRFTDEFMRDEQCINILPAQVFPRATDHVERMIEIAQALVESGFAYVRQGNVYFRVGRFPGYGELGGSVSVEGLRQGVRGEVDPLKDDPRDFALWKAAEPERTELVWPSPWGRGFPGWHIECTAMSTQHLGAQVDSTGGVDNIFPHHEDERAQSEAFTGVRPFARVWVHGQHLLADGVKMAKSTGNAYTLTDLEALEFEPLAFRYLCLTAHYRSRLNFTFTSLRAAQTGLRRLRAHVARWGAPVGVAELGAEARACREKFWATAADDLGLPRCLGLVWSLARGGLASLPSGQKAALARDFDRLLGLDLGQPPPRRTADPFRGAVSTSGRLVDGLSAPATRQVSVVLVVQPDEDLAAVERCLRSVLRHRAGLDLEVVLVDATGSPTKHGKLAQLCQAIEGDNSNAPLEAAGNSAAAQADRRSSGLPLDSSTAPLEAAGSTAAAQADRRSSGLPLDSSTAPLEAAGSTAAAQADRRSSGLPLDRSTASLEAGGGGGGGGGPQAERGTVVGAARFAAPAPVAAGDDSGRVRLVWIDHDPGAAAARNLGLRTARGAVVALLDPSVELVGDALGPLVAALSDPAVGAVGPFGLLTPDMRHFHELDTEPEPGEPREVDALQNYLLAFRRAHLARIGPLDEHYRFYRILDLDLSYTIRDRVGRVVSLGHLPIVRRRHALWEALSDGDREERSRKNFGRFLKRWDHRHDLARHGDPSHVEGPVALHG